VSTPPVGAGTVVTFAWVGRPSSPNGVIENGPSVDGGAALAGDPSN